MLSGISNALLDFLPEDKWFSQKADLLKSGCRFRPLMMQQWQRELLGYMREKPIEDLKRSSSSPG